MTTQIFAEQMGGGLEIIHVMDNNQHSPQGRSFTRGQSPSDLDIELKIYEQYLKETDAEVVRLQKSFVNTSRPEV